MRPEDRAAAPTQQQIERRRAARVDDGYTAT